MNSTGSRASLLWAFGTLAAWLAVMTLPGLLFPAGRQTIGNAVSHRLSWEVIGAIAVLFAATISMHGKNLCGFTRPRWLQALRLHWLPLSYIAVFFTFALARGLPPVHSMLYIAVNCLLVGVSEEWMFRGVLLGHLGGKTSLRKALWLSSAIFGSVHALNVLTTGVLGAALEQSFTAFLTGMMFGALRIRTGSIIPVMLVHGLFDCALLMAVTGGSGEGDGAGSTTTLGIILPVLLVLPNFLYALFLMRKIPAAEPAAAQTTTR